MVASLFLAVISYNANSHRCGSGSVSDLESAYV